MRNCTDLTFIVAVMSLDDALNAADFNFAFTSLFKCIPVAGRVFIGDEFNALAGGIFAFMIAVLDFIGVVKFTVIVFCAGSFAGISGEAVLDDEAFLPAWICAGTVLFFSDADLFEVGAVKCCFIIEGENIAVADIQAGCFLRIAAEIAELIGTVTHIPGPSIIGIFVTSEGVCMSFGFAGIIFERTISSCFFGALSAVFSTSGEEIGVAVGFAFAHGAAIALIAVNIMNFTGFTDDAAIAVTITLIPGIAIITFIEGIHILADAYTAIAYTAVGTNDILAWAGLNRCRCAGAMNSAAAIRACREQLISTGIAGDFHAVSAGWFTSLPMGIHA